MAFVETRLNAVEEVFGNNNEQKHIAAQKIIKNTIIPALEKYDNIAYIGEYYDSSSYKTKYVIDIGYENIALCLYLSTLRLVFGICAKTDTESLGYICCPINNYNERERLDFEFVTRSTSQLIFYELQMDCTLRIIEHNNVAKLIFCLCKSGLIPIDSIVLDADSFGNKYVALGNSSIAPEVYYDEKTPTRLSYFIPTVANIIEGHVIRQRMVIVKSNSANAISTDIYYMRNDVLGTNGLLRIDINGTIYMQFENYCWYIEN